MVCVFTCQRWLLALPRTAPSSTPPPALHIGLITRVPPHLQATTAPWRCTPLSGAARTRTLSRRHRPMCLSPQTSTKIEASDHQFHVLLPSNATGAHAGPAARCPLPLPPGATLLHAWPPHPPTRPPTHPITIRASMPPPLIRGPCLELSWNPVAHFCGAHALGRSLPIGSACLAPARARGSAASTCSVPSAV